MVYKFVKQLALSKPHVGATVVTGFR